MAPRVYETFLVDIVCSTLACRDHMIRFYAFSCYARDAAQSASVSLLLVQYQPLFRVGFPSHLLLRSLCPVLAQGWVVGRPSSFDLGEAGHRGCVGLDQLCLPFPACPGAVAPALACLHPLTAFVRVSAFRPGPEHLPLRVAGFLEDVFGCAVPGVMRPSPYDGVTFLHDVPCRGLRVCVQGGS
jgi:hypothetical protein